jgi:hypothetical protein
MNDNTKPALKISINLSKIDKSEIYDFKEDKYITAVLWPARDGDEYLYAVNQEISAKRREEGEKAPRLGYVKYLSKQKNEEKDLPF